MPLLTKRPDNYDELSEDEKVSIDCCIRRNLEILENGWDKEAPNKAEFLKRYLAPESGGAN